jgi:FtsZ-binding cell division protein ZapB|tara:strand:- start:28 stop:273 length:246 start_codon:yes stop_codon:yes gene_type:complete
MDYWYPLVSLKFVEDRKKMSEYNELKQATKEIEVLKSEIKTLREQTNFVMNKLEKAIEDRIVLRAENFKLKQNMVQTQIAS